MSCPWNAFAQAPTGFCEEALCAWIREPANTWSNLAFIVAAVAMYRESRGANRHLRLLGHITLATGIGSGFYHASGTAWGQLADYVGMHLGGSFMLLVCIQRWTGLRGVRALLLFWGLFFAALLPGVAYPALLRPIYAADGLLCSLSEVVLRFTRHRARDYFWLKWTWALFLLAMIIWHLDDAGIWCDPKRHWLSGHAIWHVLNAGAFYAAFQYYKQFDVLRN